MLHGVEVNTERTNMKFWLVLLHGSQELDQTSHQMHCLVSIPNLERYYQRYLLKLLQLEKPKTVNHFSLGAQDMKAQSRSARFNHPMAFAISATLVKNWDSLTTKFLSFNSKHFHCFLYFIVFELNFLRCKVNFFQISRYHEVKKEKLIWKLFLLTL